MQFPELHYPFLYHLVSLSGGQTIAYTDEGKGKQTLLFIHGLASYIPAWRENVAVLKKSFRCICVDLPGYGKSTAGTHSGKMSFYASVLGEFITTLGLQHVTPVGHSMGGHVALSLTLSHPSLIDRLILLAPAGFETFSEGEGALIKRAFTAETFQQSTEEQIRAGFAGNFFRTPAAVEPMIQDRLAMRAWENFPSHAGVVANSLYGMLDEPVFQQLSTISQHTLVIYGCNDVLIPHPVIHPEQKTAEIARAGCKKLPNSYLNFIDECGHFLQFEKPDETNRLIRAFMQ